MERCLILRGHRFEHGVVKQASDSFQRTAENLDTTPPGRPLEGIILCNAGHREGCQYRHNGSDDIDVAPYHLGTPPSARRPVLRATAAPPCGSRIAEIDRQRQALARPPRTDTLATRTGSCGSIPSTCLLPWGIGAPELLLPFLRGAWTRRRFLCLDDYAQ
eukprot:scaffold3691_cov394-Prasinococcus_capsulatus_cf.AAC.3